MKYYVYLEEHPVGTGFSAEVDADNPAQAHELGIEKRMEEFREEVGRPDKADFLAARVFEGDAITFDQTNPIYPTDVRK